MSLRVDRGRNQRINHVCVSQSVTMIQREYAVVDGYSQHTPATGYEGYRWKVKVETDRWVVGEGSKE